MAQQPVYLDENGEPIAQAVAVYLDENGNPIGAPQPMASHEPTPRAPAAGRGTQLDVRKSQSVATKALPLVGATMGGILGSALGPGGTIGGIAAGAAGAGAGGALGTGAQAVAEGRTPDLGEMAAGGGQQALLQAGGGLAGKGFALAGKGIYKGGVALLPRTLKQEFPDIAERGFNEGIALTRRGATKAGTAAKASAKSADDAIATAESSGVPPVPTREVIRELRPVGATLRKRAEIGLPDEMPALVQRAKALRASHPQGIQLTKAQSLKREAQDMADTAFRAQDKGAVIKSDDALANRAIARGLRGGIEQRVPEVAGINARTRGLMGVERGAEHASGQGHILSRLLAAGTVGGMASGGGMVPALAAAGAGAAIGTPGGLTATGLALKGLAPMASHAPDAIRAAILLQLLSGEPEQ